MWLPILLGSIVAMVVVSVVVFLVVFLARSSARSDSRTSWLAVGLVFAVFLAALVSAYASVYYKVPAGWLAAAVTAWVIVVTLMVLIAIDVRWKPIRLVVIAALFVGSVLLFALLAVAVPGLGNIFPFETTARQIGEANGFVVVLPTGQKMNTGSAPVSPLESPGQGVWIDYEGFTVEERKASGADLAKLIAVGSRPFAGSEPIPSDASTSSPLVSGATAYSAEYTPVPKQVAEENPPPGKRTAAFLVFEKDGVEVRLFSGSTEQLDNGKWVMVPGRTVAQLVKIAESMQPVD